MWASLWLYKATGTQSYLDYATRGYSSHGLAWNMDVLSWDSKSAGIKILLAQLTGQASYIQDAANLCASHLSQTRCIFYVTLKPVWFTRAKKFIIWGFMKRIWPFRAISSIGFFFQILDLPRDKHSFWSGDHWGIQPMQPSFVYL